MYSTSYKCTYRSHQSTQHTAVQKQQQSTGTETHTHTSHTHITHTHIHTHTHTTHTTQKAIAINKKYTVFIYLSHETHKLYMKRPLYNSQTLGRSNVLFTDQPWGYFFSPMSSISSSSIWNTSKINRRRNKHSTTNFELDHKRHSNLLLWSIFFTIVCTWNDEHTCMYSHTKTYKQRHRWTMGR